MSIHSVNDPYRGLFEQVFADVAQLRSARSGPLACATTIASPRHFTPGDVR